MALGGHIWEGCHAYGDGISYLNEKREIMIIGDAFNPLMKNLVNSLPRFPRRFGPDDDKIRGGSPIEIVA